MTAKPAISALVHWRVLTILLAIFFWATAGEPIEAQEQQKAQWLGKKVVQLRTRGYIVGQQFIDFIVENVALLFA